MSSENRSSSAVRNLRSLFENKNNLDASAPDSRGRSPSGIGSDKENGGGRSKVRASFVPVALARGMATVDSQGSTGRRASFTEGDEDGALLELKKTVSEQQNSKLVPENAVGSAVGSAASSMVATPDKKPGEGQLGDLPAENPDKAVTGEQEDKDMKPSDPASEDAVSGGSALKPVKEDLRSGKSKATTNGKPAAISTKAPAKPTAIKSPASQPKTPTGSKASNTTAAASPSMKLPTKKPSRSSLTAPTAASLARQGGAGSEKTTKTSPTNKPKPREVTKPVTMSSHLTAPTAASRAKHEPEAAPVPSRPATYPSRPKATTPAKSAPRASIGPRPGSRDSSTQPPRRSLAPAPDSSFLERMMKPTAASSNRTAKEKEAEAKAEAKSPPQKKAVPAKPKTNGSKGAPKAASSSVAPPAAEPEPEVEEDLLGEATIEEPVEATPALATTPAAVAAATDGVDEEPSFAGAVKEAAGAVKEAVSDTVDALASGVEAKPEPAKEGSAIPQHVQNGGEESATIDGDKKADLEATPAAMGGEETIR